VSVGKGKRPIDVRAAKEAGRGKPNQGNDSSRKEKWGKKKETLEEEHEQETWWRKKKMGRRKGYLWWGGEKGGLGGRGKQGSGNKKKEASKTCRGGDAGKGVVNKEVKASTGRRSLTLERSKRENPTRYD